MTHRLLYWIGMALTMGLTACDQHQQPVVPQYDTTIVVRYDTVYKQGQDTVYSPGARIDTIGCDTTTSTRVVELQNDRIIVGYVYSGFSTLPDAKLNTHICYAFAKLDMSADSVYQGFTVQNQTMWKKVVKLKQKNPNLKIQLSFNNCADGGGFSRMTSVPEYRKQFAKDCRKFCEDEGIDGVDLDWEWPGMAYNPKYYFDPLHDVDNYTALFKDVREEFGDDFLLTCAGPDRDKDKVSGGGYRYMDLAAVEPYVNWINMMCYDFASAPNPHNAYLCSSAYWDIMRTYQAYKRAKVPVKKCILGVAFYGRHEFDNDKEWMYKEINDVLLKRFTNTYKRVYNKTWKVPVLYKNGEMFCSYDDTVSIADKAAWALDRGMNGLMYWEVEGDNTTKDLQRACYKAMKQEVVTDTTFTFHTDTIVWIDTTYVPRVDTIIGYQVDTIITKRTNEL